MGFRWLNLNHLNFKNKILYRMFAVVEFLDKNPIKSVALVHNDWFINNTKTIVRCPSQNWYKIANEWNERAISMFKWKIFRCRIIKDNIDTFEEAHEIEKIKGKFSSTSSEEEHKRLKLMKRRHPVLSLKDCVIPDLNEINNNSEQKFEIQYVNDDGDVDIEEDDAYDPLKFSESETSYEITNLPLISGSKEGEFTQIVTFSTPDAIKSLINLNSPIVTPQSAPSTSQRIQLSTPSVNRPVTYNNILTTPKSLCASKLFNASTVTSQSESLGSQRMQFSTTSVDIPVKHNYITTTSKASNNDLKQINVTAQDEATGLEGNPFVSKNPSPVQLSLPSNIQYSELQNQIKSIYDVLNGLTNQLTQIQATQDVILQVIHTKPTNNRILAQSYANLRHEFENFKTLQELQEFNSKLKSDDVYFAKTTEFFYQRAYKGHAHIAHFGKVKFMLNFILHEDIRSEFTWSGSSSRKIEFDQLARQKEAFSKLDGIVNLLLASCNFGAETSTYIVTADDIRKAGKDYFRRQSNYYNNESPN